MWSQLRKKKFDSGRCLFLVTRNHEAEIPPALASPGQVITLFPIWKLGHSVTEGTAHVPSVLPEDCPVSHLDHGAWSNNLPSPRGASTVQSKGLLFHPSLDFWSWREWALGAGDSPYAWVEGAEMPVSVRSRCTITFQSIWVILGQKHRWRAILKMWFQLRCIFANSSLLPFLPTLVAQPLCFL